MSALRILMIEDEPPARERLTRLLASSAVDTQLVGECSSCSEAKRWLATHAAPDVILCDIRLGDGLALEIFSEHPPACPIIFCTAYDRYVLEALEVGGIDYLLKPVEPARLEKALAKVVPRILAPHDVGALLRHLAGATPKTTRRFLVRRNGAFVSIPVDDIAYCFSEHKLTTLVERTGATSYLDDTLTALEPELPGFFRANRAFLLSRDCVRRFHVHSRGRLSLELEPSVERAVLVSLNSAPAFKRWLEGRPLKVGPGD